MRPVEVLAAGITRALAALCPSATDRLLADLKTTAAADCPRDGRTPTTNPERGTKS